MSNFGLNLGTRSQNLNQEQQREQELQRQIAKEQQIQQQQPEVYKQVEAAINKQPFAQDALKNYTEQEQQYLKEVMSKIVFEHHHTATPPKIDYITTLKSSDQFVVQADTWMSYYINPREILNDRAERIREAAVQEAQRSQTPEEQAARQQAEKIAAGLRAGIAPDDPEWTKKMQEQGLIEPAQNRPGLQSYQAKESDSALKVAKALNPDNPEVALGYLLDSKQIKYIRGDNGHIIPNIRPGKTYNYPPEQHTQEQQLQHLARTSIGLESRTNQQIDQQTRLAEQKKQEAAQPNWLAKAVEQSQNEPPKQTWMIPSVRLAEEQNRLKPVLPLNFPSIPSHQNDYRPTRTDLVKATTNHRIIGLDNDQVSQSIQEGIEKGHSIPRIALNLTMKKTAYEAWNFISLGFVKENDQLLTQRDQGLLSNSQYWQAATLSAGTKIAAISTGGALANAARFTTPIGLAGTGIAMDAEIQLGNMGVYHLTQGRAGQAEYSLTQSAIMGASGYGLGRLGSMPVMNKPLFNKTAQQEATALTRQIEQNSTVQLEQQSLQATKEALNAQGNLAEALKKLNSTRQTTLAAQSERIAAEETRINIQKTLEQAEQQLKQNIAAEHSLLRHREQLDQAIEKVVTAQNQEQAARLIQELTLAEVRSAEDIVERSLQRPHYIKSFRSPI